MHRASRELRTAYILALADLDRLFSEECCRHTVGFFPTVRVWICPHCESTIPDVGGLPGPLDMAHASDCDWLSQLHEWPPELVDFYIAAWMQRSPHAKRIIRATCTKPNPQDSSGS